MMLYPLNYLALYPLGGVLIPETVSTEAHSLN
jgi:hypothetical protein